MRLRARRSFDLTAAVIPDGPRIWEQLEERSSRRGVEGCRSSQATPSFFCSELDEVVYWKVSRFSG